MGPTPSAPARGVPRRAAPPCRIVFGRVSSISALRLLTPTVASIAAMSDGEGPLWRRAKSRATSVGAVMGISSRRMGFVGGFIHHAVEFALVGNLHPEEPRLAA